MKEIKLDISPDFTMEDIRKIRDYHYEMTKDMTREERRAYNHERWSKAGKWYEDFLAEREAQHWVAAEPETPYGSKT